MSRLRRNLPRSSVLAMDAESGGAVDHAGFNRCPRESHSLARLIGSFEPDGPTCADRLVYNPGLSLGRPVRLNSNSAPVPWLDDIAGPGSSRGTRSLSSRRTLVRGLLKFLVERMRLSPGLLK
jgi:hypothetical protein